MGNSWLFEELFRIEWTRSLRKRIDLEERGFSFTAAELRIFFLLSVMLEPVPTNVVPIFTIYYANKENVV